MLSTVLTTSSRALSSWLAASSFEWATWTSWRHNDPRIHCQTWNSPASKRSLRCTVLQKTSQIVIRVCPNEKLIPPIMIGDHALIWAHLIRLCYFVVVRTSSVSRWCVLRGQLLEYPRWLIIERRVNPQLFSRLSPRDFWTVGLPKKEPSGPRQVKVTKIGFGSQSATNMSTLIAGLVSDFKVLLEWTLVDWFCRLEAVSVELLDKETVRLTSLVNSQPVWMCQ